MQRNSLTKQNARNKAPGFYPEKLRENLLYSNVTGQTDNWHYSSLCAECFKTSFTTLKA
jgi:hypothetical protein